MIGGGTFLRRSRRHTTVLVGVVAVSGLVLGGLAVARAAQVEADTRATLLAQLDHERADLDGIAERASAAQAITEQKQSCIDAEIQRLQPAISAPARFSPAVVAIGTAVTVRAAAPVSDATEASIVLIPDAVDTGIDELRTAVAELHELRIAQGSEATRAMLVARERAAACDTARSAVASAIADVAARTDAVIAANGLASPASIAELRAARDAVLATDEAAAGAGADALPRWIAAVAAVEAAQAASVAEAAKAAEAATEAAAAASERESVSGGLKASSSAPLPPNLGRQLTPEEVAALGMPPGSIIYEVDPSAYPPPLG